MRYKRDDNMVPYVLKLPPAMIAQVKAAAEKVRAPGSWRRTGISASAFIRRAITRDLEHAARSRGRKT